MEHVVLRYQSIVTAGCFLGEIVTKRLVRINDELSDIQYYVTFTNMHRLSNLIGIST